MYTFTVAIAAVLIRWCLSLWKYSGESTPPMFGDFEAQRHWMEICYHVSPSQWYLNSSDNNLLYWGLDYPPLTAYHSFLCGGVAHRIDPRFVALGSSRGFESYNLKLFMRSAVLVSDLLVYFPATILYCRAFLSSFPSFQRSLFLILLLLPPPIILIDYCHFQFNAVSLGLALLAYVMMGGGYDVIGCVFFTASLNYKQMELYHALPFFCYLLGKAFRTRYLYVVMYALSVCITFIIIWLPFLHSSYSVIQVLHRLFPFERGVFEDKVASIWCVLEVLIKIRRFVPQNYLIYTCLASTLIALLPSSIHLVRKPTIHNLMLALASSSLIFFLFSFHVHEKSILLAVLPATLLLPYYPYAMTWFLTIATFSLFPLLHREGNILPAFAMAILFYQICNTILVKTETTSNNIKTLHAFSMLGCVLISLLPLGLAPPPSKPDLFPVLNAVYSCSHFIGFLTYFHHLQLTSHTRGYIGVNGELIFKRKKRD